MLTTVWWRFWRWRLFKIYQGWGLVKILKLKLEILKLKFGQHFEADVWSRFWDRSLVNILWLKIGQHFEPEVWSRFWCWISTNLRHDLKTVILLKAILLAIFFTYPLLAISTEFDLFKTIFPIFTHFHFLRGRLTWHIGCCNIKHQAMHTFLSFCWFCNCLQLLFPVAVAPSQCHPSWNIATSMSLSSFLLF